MNRNIITAILTIIVLVAVWYFGYRVYPRCNPCPVVKSDTVYVYDTVTHTIRDTVPYYITKRDSVIYRDTVFKDVDTAEILKDYFALHYYTRNWEDSLLTVTLQDVITQNKSVDNTFTYKLLQPQTVINNEVVNKTYSRYIIIGGEVALKDLKGVDPKVKYITSKWYAGVGYSWRSESLELEFGLPIWRFK